MPPVMLDTAKRSGRAQEFEEMLRRRVIGQDNAIDKLVEVYQMFLAGFNAPGRPIANLLFLGPTGTGKTRLVEAAAEVLIGNARACIKIDCAEFQHSHEIAKLIGSPPGYLGHRETHPILTQEALDQWHTDKLKFTLVLFDEIEKASDALWQLMLGIMDKATLTLGDNRRVDFSNCVIVMTSNLGASEMSALIDGKLGFNSPAAFEVTEALDDKIERVAREAAKRKFTPEWMNRIDKIAVFKTLRAEHLTQILDIELGRVQARILTTPAKFVFTCGRKMKDYLLKLGTEPKYGARELKRVIERELVFPLANLATTQQLKTGDLVQVSYLEERVSFIKLDDDLDMERKIADSNVTPTVLRKGRLEVQDRRKP